MKSRHLAMGACVLLSFLSVAWAWWHLQKSEKPHQGIPLATQTANAAKTQPVAIESSTRPSIVLRKFKDGTTLALHEPTDENQKEWGFREPYAEGHWDGEKELGDRVLPATNNGLVLINGRYVPPPYQFSRVGGCLFLNGILFRQVNWVAETQSLMREIPMPEKISLGIDLVNGAIEDQANKLTRNSLLHITCFRTDPTDKYPAIYESEITQNEMNERTIEWGELMASDIPAEEKLRRHQQTENVPSFYFERRTIENLMASDRAAFLTRLRAVVHEATERSRHEEERQFPSFTLVIDTLGGSGQAKQPSAILHRMRSIPTSSLAPVAEFHHFQTTCAPVRTPVFLKRRPHPEGPEHRAVRAHVERTASRETLLHLAYLKKY